MARDLKFGIYIAKILGDVHSDTSISGVAKAELNSITNVIARNIARRAVIITQKAGRRTILKGDVIAAMQLLFSSSELSKHAAIQGAKAIASYKDNIHVNTSVAARANLNIPPSRMKRIIKDPSNTHYNVSADVPIYLAAFVEYILAEILELSGNSARDNKRVRITVQDVQNSARGDLELCNLFTKMNIKFAGGGNVRNIHSALLPVLKKKKYY